MSTDRFFQFYQTEAKVYHDRRYGGRYGRVFQSLHHEVLGELLKNIECESPILEIACGTGHTTELLVNRGFDVIACDLTPEMMARASTRIEQHSNQVVFVRTDAFHLPFPDDSVATLVSTRFLHLFPMAEQQLIVQEMERVLKPGGVVLVDFDNWTHRWIWALPFAIYNIVKYRRLAPYSIYNRIAPTTKMLSKSGLTDLEVRGIGGAQLLLPAIFSTSLALRWGRRHRFRTFRLLADHFMIRGLKG